MKRNKLIESRIISLWNKIYPETKQYSKKPGRTAAALLRKKLKEQELTYLNKVLVYLGKTMYLDKVMQALIKNERCEICGNISHPNHHNICQKCYSLNINKYKLIRRNRAHDKSQELRSYSLRNRSTEAKTKTLKKFRKTMALNWEGGHNTRDPKFRKSYVEKYGFSSPFSLPNVRLKSKEKFKKNFGINSNGHNEYLEKREATCLLKYGVTNPTKNPIIALKALKSSHLIKIVRLKGKKFKVQGNSEVELLKLLVSKYGVNNVYSQFSKSYPKDKALLLNWTPDFYVKGKGFFECKSTYTLYDKSIWYESNKKKAKNSNVQWCIHLKGNNFVFLPLDWHSKSKNKLIYLCNNFTVNRILNILKEYPNTKKLRDRVLFKDTKIAICFSYSIEEKSYRILYLWPHEVHLHLIAVLNILRTVLNKNKYRIGARKCKILEVSKNESREFLNKYHLQGNTNSSYRYGLFYEDKLISIATFRKPITNKKYEWELARFCTKSNYNVQGGLSRLIHHFQSLYHGTIISYADKRWATGNSYIKAGFKQLKDSKPGYFYIKDNLIISRYQAQKHKLQYLLKNYDPELSETKNMLNSGFIKVTDLGQYVFVKQKS